MKATVISEKWSWNIGSHKATAMNADKTVNLDPRLSNASYYEDDLEGKKRIKINPSTELIADEYETSEKNGLIYIFRGIKKTDDTNTLKILNTLEKCGYEIPSQNIVGLDTKKAVELQLKRISEEDHTDKSSLIIIFLGEVETDDEFIFESDSIFKMSTKDVWVPFINCPTLKSKPKIFIFQACKFQRKVSQDTHTFFIDKQEYDIPTEADMLIVYKKIEGMSEARLEFMEQLCDNFQKYGRRDDIIGLVTHTGQANERRPLIISTLTKKFYIIGSGFRDHYLDIDDQQELVMNTIRRLQHKISLLESHDVKRRKVKRTSSFRKIVNRITQRIGNTRLEEPMEVDCSPGSRVPIETTTEIPAERKRIQRKLSAPKPVPRKSSNVENSKGWRP